MRALFGADPIDSGDIYVNGKKVTIKSPQDAVKCGIGYLSEDRKRFGIVVQKTVAENTTMADLDEFSNGPFIDKKKEKEIAFGLFREGDKVMQIKNNYQIEWEMRNSKGFTVDKGVGVFNGDMGIITEINDYTEKITVLFDETREVQYPYASLDELELAYAVTIHKSQGSEYPAVVMPILSGPRVLFHRNLLYTGVTRAKNCLTIVGDRNMLFSMIQNVNEQRRYTTLALRLDQIANESEESGPMDDLGI